MAKKQAKPNSNIKQLWPTSILVKRFNEYQRVNPALLELFYQHRDNEKRASKQSYVSTDTLLAKYDSHAELQSLAGFIKDSVYEIASEVNAPYWRQGDQINLNLTGLWFQIANGHAFHEVHTHGNCSWSGVYYVRAANSTSADQADTKKTNGITRFYGPHMDNGAGGHAEYGNLYLQDYTWDSHPEDGRLVVFPSYLKHMAFPYVGEEDRVIVSFHARLDNDKGLRFSSGYSMN